MNADFPQNEREQLEAKLTALLLGELPAAEAIEIGKAMERDPELAALYERLKVTIGLVRESAAQPTAETSAQAKPLKMSTERREKLLAQFKTVAPKEFAKPTFRVSVLLQFAAVVAILALLAAMLFPALSNAKLKSSSASVINNLRMVEIAKQQWAEDNKKSGDAAPTLQELRPYLGRGESGLPSVAGEAYVPGKVSESATVEASPAQAKKLIGRREVTVTPVGDGNLQFSLLPPESMQVATAIYGSSSASAGSTTTVASSAPSQQPRIRVSLLDDVTTSTPVALKPAAPSRTEIVLPTDAPGQTQNVGALNDQTKVAMNMWAIDTYNRVGNLDSDGSVQQASAEGLQKAFTNGQFAFNFDNNPGLTKNKADGFDLNVVTNSLGDDPQWVGFLEHPDQAHSDNLFFSRNATLVPSSGQLASNGSVTSSSSSVLTALSSSKLSGSVDSSTMWNLGTGNANEPAYKFWGTTSTVRGFYDDNLNSGVEAAKNDSTGKGTVLGGMPTLGTAFQGESNQRPDANGSNSVLLQGQVQANGGSLPTGGFGGGGGGFGGKSVVTGNTNSQTSEYLAATKSLKNEKRWRQILAMRTGQEAIETNLPTARMVRITEPATVVAADKLSFGDKVRKAWTGKVESSARIEIEQERPDIAGLSSGQVAAGYDPYFIQTEQETIKSDAVLKKVVENLRLDGGDKSKTQAAVQQLKKDIDVGTVKNTKAIEITAKSAKPEEAALIANSVAQAYKDYRAEQYYDLKNQGIGSLKQQLAESDKKVEVAQAKVNELRKGLGVNDFVAAAPGGVSLMTAGRLRELTALRVQQEAEYNQQNTLLEKLKPMDHESLKRVLPIATTDSQLNTLISELDLAEQALIKLKVDYAPNHPKCQSAQALVDDLKHKIDDRVDGILLGLQTKAATSKAALDQLNQEIDKEEDSPESKIQIPKPPLTPQPEILTRENAFSTFSLNVSDVSFKLAAASLEKGQMPEPASIRSEEFINAFNYRDPDAGPGVPIAFASERARYPFAHNRELLRFSLKTAAAGRQAGKSLNIVLLLDNSGSMERADRVRIIQEALRVLAGQLQKGDTFSIVTFARTATLRVDGVHGDQAAAAAAEIAKLTPEGGTNLGDALDLAYETALHHYLVNGDNRVVLLTDGAANLGDVNPNLLKQKVEAHRKQGVALDCFGIGWEDYNDDLLEVLTRNGDGRYGFINTPEQASTEFVAQIAGALHVAAADVKVQVEFNPKRVTSYRQIGYAKHQLAKEQFRDNTVDAAEIAAQEAGNALYTIETNPQGEGSIATVRVRYKVPATGEYREQSWDVPYTGIALDQASPAMRLATTASAFSEWLATSPFASEVTTDQLLRYLNGVPKIYGADARPKKLEWMIRQAGSISGK